MLAGELPDDHGERSGQKPDLEALTVLPPFEGHPYGALLGLGSGSAPDRDRGFVCGLAADGSIAGEPDELSLAPLYRLLREHVAELNVEGAATMGERLWLLHRGESQEGSNLVVELSLEQLLHSLRNDLCLDAEELEDVRRYDLGDIDGVELTFSDATPIADQLLVFTASAEADDGRICGSVVGTLGLDGSVQRLRTIDRRWKVEGVHAAIDTGVLDFTFVCDQDDPEAPAPLLSATMPLEGRLEGTSAPERMRARGARGVDGGASVQAMRGRGSEALGAAVLAAMLSRSAPPRRGARAPVLAAPARGRPGRREAPFARSPLTPTPQAELRPGLAARDRPAGAGQPRGPRERPGRKGFTCNTALVGSYTQPNATGTVGGFKVERYVDAAGHDCAYYDTTLHVPDERPRPGGRRERARHDGPGASPSLTDRLVTPAMQTPHESLVLSHRRGLLAAVAGNLTTNVGEIDIYDISKDCRHPELKSSTPIGFLGHESGLAPDGRTFYSASPSGKTLVAVDISNPSVPVPIWFGNYDSHGLSISDDGNRAYVAGHRLRADHPRHDRGPGARARTRTVPRGRPPPVELDEHPAERDPDHDQGPSRTSSRSTSSAPSREVGAGPHHRHRRRDAARGSSPTCASRCTSRRTSTRSRRTTTAPRTRFRATPATTATCRRASTPGSWRAA